MLITKIEKFYQVLPLVCFLFAFFCWLAAFVIHYRTACLLITQLFANFFTTSGLNFNSGTNVRLLVASGNVGRATSSRVVLFLSVILQLLILLGGLLSWYWCRSSLLLPGRYLIPDSFSFSLMSLTAFIFLLCFGLLTKEKHRYLPFWCGLLFILEGFLLMAFSVDNVLLFYVSFEGTLLPMYLLIGGWGSRARKIKANYYFFLYTLAGSLVTLLGLIILYYKIGSFSYAVILQSCRDLSISSYLFGGGLDHFIWLLLSIGFLVKLPLFVLHLWLPEAHVEAPTIGSVILAALLLKLGLYGFIRLPFGLFASSTAFWLPWFLPIVFLGIIYPAAVAVVQDDMKKIVAYSSVSHMSFALLGLLAGTVEGVSGAMFLSIGHGLVSGGLFTAVGLLYDRYRTRDVKYLGGLASSMPYFSLFFILLSLGNMGFPFLCNFPGELLLLIGSFSRFGWFIILFGIGFFLTAVYSLRLVNLILFGAPKPAVIANFYDVTREEYAVLFSFSLAVVLLGVFCAPLVHALELVALSLVVF